MEPADDQSDEDEQRHRASSQIEMLQSFPPPEHGGGALMAINDSVDSDFVDRGSNYQSFHDQLNHTISVVRNSMDNNSNNNNMNHQSNDNSESDNDNDDMRESSTDNDNRNPAHNNLPNDNNNNTNNNNNNNNNDNNDNNSMNRNEREPNEDGSKKTAKNSLNDIDNDNDNDDGDSKEGDKKKIINRLATDEIDTSNHVTSGYSNNDDNDSQHSHNNNNNNNNNNNKNGKKSRKKRVKSEPPKNLANQLAEFQTQMGSNDGTNSGGELSHNGKHSGSSDNVMKNKNRNKNKNSSHLLRPKYKRTQSATYGMTGSGSYRLMEDPDFGFESTIMTQTATLHPAKADHHFLVNKSARSQFERLDFDIQESEIIHRLTWQRGRKHDSRGFTKWTLCLIIGVATGSCMFCVYVAIEQIKSLNLSYTNAGLSNNLLTGFLRFLFVNLMCSLVASCLVVYISPAAAGSGIPDVKAWLNGSYIPTLFAAKTLVVKLVGIVFSVSSFFVVGKEGPMVHTGSALASGIALGRNKALGMDSKLNYSFRNDADSRDLISCGAGAGVAAAFGAPIGGMLFALEEVSSFWMPGLTWRAFFTAATSNFVLQLWLGCYKEGECGKVSKSSLISFESDSNITEGLYNMKEFLFFVIMGVVGGIVGMLFNGINVRLCLWKKQNLTTNLSKIIQVLLMSGVTAVCLCLTPMMFSCETYDSTDTNCSDPYSYGAYTCSANEWNPLASLFLQSSENIIAALFHESSGCWSSSVLLCSSIIYFFLAVFTYGISIPSGLFVPLILIGSNLGHFLGDFWNELWDDDFDVGTYALIGASAVLGGSTRMTISLTAIVLEITNDIYYLMPIMTTIMVAKWVGDRFNSALYDSHVGLKDIPYLEAKLPSWIPTYICADDVMIDKVTTLPIVINLNQLLKILNDPKEYHNAFPIIESKSKLSYPKIRKTGWNQTDGRYVGIILRWHILIMLSNGLYTKKISELKNLPKLEFKDLADRTHKGDRIINPQDYKLPPKHEWKHYYLDLSPYMSLSPHALVRQAPIRRVYHMFRAFGMRHLVIVDAKTQAIAGIITTHELLEPTLEEVVERVHHLFDFDPLKTEELFEERLKFLAGQTASLRTSGRLNNPYHDKWKEHQSTIRRATQQSGGGSGHLDIINDDHHRGGGGHGMIRASQTTYLPSINDQHNMDNNNNDMDDLPVIRYGNNTSANRDMIIGPMHGSMGGGTGSVMDRIENSPSRTPSVEHSPDRTPDPPNNSKDLTPKNPRING